MTLLEQMEAFGSMRLAITELFMNQQTYDRLVYRYGVETRGTAHDVAEILSGIRVGIDDALPWNVIEEKTRNERLEVVKTERFPAFAPDLIRDLEGNVLMP